MITNEQQKKLYGRLSRISGQVRALERLIAKNDHAQVIAQFEAAIAALKSAMTSYLTDEILAGDINQADKEILVRQLRK